jgi:hypothetical protein
MPEPTRIHFLDQPIEVAFETPPARQKTPHCPDGFIWDGCTYHIIEKISEWTDFTRRGHAELNMQPAHALTAASRGSLNVGRFYFRVRVDTGQLFDLYYDRAAKNADDRKGRWLIYAELSG